MESTPGHHIHILLVFNAILEWHIHSEVHASALPHIFQFTTACEEETSVPVSDMGAGYRVVRHGLELVGHCLELTIGS